ncbi:MAG: hypothetical protein K2J76_07860 [Oscillospiraceae bacterium]|nr:hypothetical protein [Oscillospiraceae bacterium]
MNATFAKKCKTAVKITNKLLVLWFTVAPFINILAVLMNDEKDSKFMVILQSFCYGSCLSLLYTVIINSQFLASIHHLITLPFTMKDIKDIGIINILFNTMAAAVIQCAVIAIFSPETVPYTLCMIIVNVALGIGYLLLCFTDKRILSSPSRASSVEQSRRYVAVVVTLMLVIMFGAMALSTFIMYRGVTGTLADNMPMLIIISAAAIVVSVIEALICKNIKTEIN